MVEFETESTGVGSPTDTEFECQVAGQPGSGEVVLSGAVVLLGEDRQLDEIPWQSAFSLWFLKFGLVVIFLVESLSLLFWISPDWGLGLYCFSSG